MKKKNLFQNLPEALSGEVMEVLVKTKKCRIERIISKGHSSPEDFWYDQEQDEWVMVLAGKAGIAFQKNDTIVEMNPGDSILIPAHERHRVAWTDPGTETVWLAVHIWEE